MESLFENKNGRTYKVLNFQPFNKVDEDYYKDSWQVCMHALMENQTRTEWVVVNLVGETSWGSGTYYSSKKNAVEDYTERVKKYLLL